MSVCAHCVVYVILAYSVEIRTMPNKVQNRVYKNEAMSKASEPEWLQSAIEYYQDCKVKRKDITIREMARIYNVTEHIMYYYLRDKLDGFRHYA